MDSAVPSEEESRGILGQLSRRPVEPRPSDPWRQYLDPANWAPSALPIPPALPPIFPPAQSNSSPYQSAPSWLPMRSPFGSSLEPSALPAQPVNQPRDYSSTDQIPAMSEQSMPQVPPVMPPSYSAPLMPSSWDPNSPSLWHRPVASNAEFPAPAATDDDPFTRAARRTRQSVQLQGGRQPGFTTAILQNLLPATVQGMATLPQRALTAAGDLQRTGDQYDPGPVLDTAMLMVGSPLTPRGALGSGARRPPRLPMDEASRMARADAMGFQRNRPVEYGTAPAGEKISAAAFNVNGRVFTAPMHYEALEDAERELGMPYSQMQHAPIPEGFVTNAGRYVSRLEAAEIAQRAHQAEKTGIWGDELTSEDTKMSGVRPSSKVRVGATAPGLPGGQGVWGWVLPGEAASIPPSPLRPRTQRRTAMANPEIQATEGAAIPPAPIWHRAERLFPLDARGLKDAEIQASLKEAWDQGHDAVMLRNYTSPGGRSGDILVVKDPAQLRSPNAKFDPAKRNSNDLSASIAALLGSGAAVHALGEATSQANDEAFWNAWRRGEAL
jgi:hypothetical protein